MRVAAVQMALRFFEDAADFKATIDSWVERAAGSGAELVVFPEDVGLPLVCIDDADLASRADNMMGLAAAMARRYWWPVLKSIVTPGVNARSSLFLYKGSRIRELYTGAFCEAARRHRVHVVAGSALLPGASPDGKLLYNDSYVFGPDGQSLGSSRKIEGIPIETDELGIKAGTLEDVGVMDVRGTRIGVVICLDVWNAQTVAHVTGRGAKIVASPQANPLPWTEEEKTANREGLYARCQELGVYGIQAMGVGELAGLVFEGQSAIMGPADTPEDDAGIIAEAPDGTQEALVVADIDV